MRVWHILLIVALALVGQAPARAALTGFTLTNPDQSGFVGDLLTFEGTVTNDNTTGDVFINNYVMSGDPDLATRSPSSSHPTWISSGRQRRTPETSSWWT